MFEIKVDDMFELQNEKYITIETAFLKDFKYLFVNKLDENENPTSDYSVFKVVNDGLLKETDQKNLEILLEFFSEKVNEKVKMLNSQNEKVQ